MQEKTPEPVLVAKILKAFLPEEKLMVAKHIRKRPAMYLGSVDARGILELCDKLFALFLTSAADKPCNIAIHIHGNGRFGLQIQGELDWLEAIAKIDAHHFFAHPWILQALHALSSQLVVQYYGVSCHFTPWDDTPSWKHIAQQEASILQLDFELDASIFPVLEINPADFRERISIISTLHPAATFALHTYTDSPSQTEHFHSPQGLVHLYQQTKASLGLETLGDLQFQGRWAGHTYQMVVGFAAPDTARLRIRTFANGHETIEGGSLIDGIATGIRNAIQVQCQSRQPALKLGRKELKRHLLVAAVAKGGNFQFLHPTRNRLGTPAVEHAAREIAFHLMMEQFVADPAFLDRLLQLMELSS